MHKQPFTNQFSAAGSAQPSTDGGAQSNKKLLGEG